MNLMICVCFCAVGFVVLRSAHRIEDVNVNTDSQRKGMCEARKIPRGQGPTEEGRGEERKEGGGKWDGEEESGFKRSSGEEEWKEEKHDDVRS